MKKITGKVVSLVLALALVVTSFSANFAFATTKSVSGTADFDGEDTIYLVNGGTTDSGRTVYNFNSQFVKGTVDTKDHQDNIGTAEISAISHVSGDKLIKWDIDADTISLRSKTSEGKEVISILYKATYSNDDGDDVTVKASKQFTVYAFDADSPIIRMYDSGTAAGKAPDEVGSFARNDNSSKTIAVYKATAENSGSARATWKTTLQPIIKPADAQDTTATNAELLDSTKVNKVATVGDYYVYSDNSHVALTVNPADNNSITAKVVAPATSKLFDLAPTGNVSITAKKIITGIKVSTDSDDKEVAKTKIDKKVIAPAGYLSIGKDKGTYLYSNTLDAGDSNIDVANSEVVFGGADNVSATIGNVTVSEGSVNKVSGKIGTLTIAGASVSTVDLDTGDVVVSDDDAKVGDITTDDNGGAVGNTGKVTVNAGRVGNINTTDASIDTVEVTGGSTGTIASDGIVNIATDDEETPIVTGNITAKTVTLDSSNGKITTGTIKSSDDGTIELDSGDYALSVKGFDFDYRATALTLSDFAGKIAAPVNAVNGSLDYTTDEDDQIATTVTGAAKFDSMTIDEYTTLAFDNTVEVGDVSGSGSLKVLAGKLYVTGSASGVTLKLADTTLAVGAVAFKADTDCVDVDDFTTFGFTVAKTAGSSVDTFKIVSTNFGGIVIDTAAANVAVGYTKTYTVVSYPTGTTAPAGSKISWDFDGSDDVFQVTTSGNTATVKVLKTDSTFSSENTGTLTATLQDADGYDLDDYTAATATVTAVTTPDATSDTNSAVSVAKGASYTMKVTSAVAPAVTTGSNGVFAVALVSKNGNNYFYKLTATGDVGKATGVYLNGNKIFVATVKAFAFTSDTTKATVKGAYTFKITSATTPTVSVGSAAFKLAFVSKTGNAYLYKITSAGKAGAQAGIYVNGAKAFVATVG